jgi:hypothetical protein
MRQTSCTVRPKRQKFTPRRHAFSLYATPEGRHPPGSFKRTPNNSLEPHWKAFPKTVEFSSWTEKEHFLVS